MSHFLLKAGVSVCAFALLGFAGQASATPRPALDGVTGLMILTGDEENAEVQNLLEPETDEGTPMDAPGGDSATPPSAPEEGAEMKAKPGEDMEQKELESEDR